MKRILAFILAGAMALTGCAQHTAAITETTTMTAEEESLENDDKQEETEEIESSEEIEINKRDNQSFDRPNDPEFLQYIKDIAYAEIEDSLQSDDYTINDINAVYISQEYLDELEYNSKSNIWFGYTTEQLKEEFGDTSYIITLGDNGETVAEPFEGYYDDTYKKVLKNIAVGSGIILIGVTLTAVSASTGNIPLTVFFAYSTSGAIESAVPAALFGSAIGGAAKEITTGKIDEALKEAAISGSEGFKWGIITGAVLGGATGVYAAQEISKELLWRQAEMRALLKYGGEEQVSFLNGERVLTSTQGATRPDIVRTIGDHIEAIEVKYYNLESETSLSLLSDELKRQVGQRVNDLPENATQRVVLDVTKRGYSKEIINDAVDYLETHGLYEIYPNLPIDVIGA